MAETVLGAIANARFKTGMFKAEKWILVVTDQRLLGARLSDEVVRGIVDQARAQAGHWGPDSSASGAPNSRLRSRSGNATAPWPRRRYWPRRRAIGRCGPDLDFLKITIEAAGGKGTYDTEGDDPGQREVQALLARTRRRGPTRCHERWGGGHPASAAEQT